MTYEQELRRLYELLTAADDQARIVVDHANSGGVFGGFYNGFDVWQIAADISQVQFRLRAIIHQAQEERGQ